MSPRLRLLWLPLLVACASAPAGPRPYPGQLVPPGELPGAVLYRQRVEVRFPGREPARFEAVVQKKGDALLVVGLGPMATRAFTIELRGAHLQVEYKAPEARAVPPQHLLHDVERAFFRGLPGAPLGDGTHQGTDRGEQVSEAWQDGRLQARTFRREDTPGALRIAYTGGWEPGSGPPPLELENGWLGYALSIETVQARPLE